MPAKVLLAATAVRAARACLRRNAEGCGRPPCRCAMRRSGPLSGTSPVSAALHLNCFVRNAQECRRRFARAWCAYPGRFRCCLRECARRVRSAPELAFDASLHLAAAGEAGTVKEQRQGRCPRSEPASARRRLLKVGACDGLAQHRPARCSRAQTLAGRGRIARPKRVHLANRVPDRCPAGARCDPCAPPQRTASAARRTRGTRRSAACWSSSPGRGCGRDRSGTVRSAWIMPRDSTTALSVAYAPPSKTASMSTAVSRPSRVTPVRCRMTAGCRLVVASMSSTRS